MIGKMVEIIHDDNFYEGMVGTVMDEGKYHVFVEIEFTNDSHKVLFYKEQVQIYDEN
jgi:ribosomal protein L21E